jgi:hypothetical protein
VWAGPRDLVVKDGRQRTDDRLPLSERFPALAAQQLGTRVEHFVYGAQAAIDRRAGRPHWSQGWRLSSTVQRFEEPVETFAFHSASTPSVPFTRWIHEGEAGVSFWSDPRTFRIYARVEDTRDFGSAGLFPIYDLVTLGGRAGLSGFEPGRFRDADLMVGRLTYIFPAGRYLEWDLHTELGGVMSRLENARVADFENSYGVALRFRTGSRPVGSVGVDWSHETTRFRFSVGGVE